MIHQSLIQSSSSSWHTPRSMPVLLKSSVIITLNYFFDLVTGWSKTTEIIKLRKIIRSMNENYIIPVKISKMEWTGMNQK